MKYITKEFCYRIIGKYPHISKTKQSYIGDKLILFFSILFSNIEERFFIFLNWQKKSC